MIINLSQMFVSRVPSVLLSGVRRGSCFRTSSFNAFLPLVGARFSSSSTALRFQFSEFQQPETPKLTLTGTVEEYFDLIRGRAMGISSPTTNDVRPAPVELKYMDAMVLSLIKELWPELAATQVTNQINPQRLCLNIPSPISSHIRPYSVHTTAEALTIITYLDDEETLRLGLRWWTYVWSTPLNHTSSTFEDIVKEGAQDVRQIQTQPSSSIISAVKTMLAIARGIFDCQLKLRSEVWLDRDADQRLVRTYLVKASEPDVPANSSDFETVLTLTWKGASFSTAEGKPFLNVPLSKQTQPFVLTPTPTSPSTPSPFTPTSPTLSLPSSPSATTTPPREGFSSLFTQPKQRNFL